jgi:hypothetical protein
MYRRSDDGSNRSIDYGGADQHEYERDAGHRPAPDRGMHLHRSRQIVGVNRAPLIVDWFLRCDPLRAFEAPFVAI